MADGDKTTILECSRSTCDGCKIRGKVICFHTPSQVAGFAVFTFFTIIPFFIGMIVSGFWLWLIVWFVLALIFFLYLEQYILCRHCPHYAEEGRTLRCHANWGLPKFPPFDPHPLKKWEKVVWIIYVALLFLYFVPFFIISSQWIFLIVCSVMTAISVILLLATRCNRCYVLSCPFNRVTADVKEGVLANFPRFAEAWRESRKGVIND
jgi:hypothetical protein